MKAEDETLKPPHLIIASVETLRFVSSLLVFTRLCFTFRNKFTLNRLKQATLPP